MAKETYRSGVTLIEIMVTVAVMMLLIGGAIWADRALIATTEAGRNSERAQDTSSIARSFETYYRNNPTALGPTYPTTSQVTNSIDDLIDDPEIITPPRASGPNLTAATSAGTQLPAENEYIYQPFTAAAAPTLCSSAPCVRFTLHYRDEKTGSVVQVESSHQQ